jgi:hypothetical protein
LFKFLLATASNKNMSTFTGEEFCSGEADTLSAPGNDSHFPLQFAHFILSAGRVDAGSVCLPSRGYRVRTPTNQAPIAAHSIGKADQSTLDAGAKSFSPSYLDPIERECSAGLTNRPCRGSVEEA